MGLEEKIVLNNGVEMPIFGLGVYDSGEDTKKSVSFAIQNGYRLIDTAAFYGNEKEVGQAVKLANVPREDIFITTKIWNDRQRDGSQKEAFYESLKALDLEYIDLFLIHWPVPGKIAETWKILEDLYEEKLIRAIGVSNFYEHHIEELSVKANIAPAVDQMELHPHLTRLSLREYLKEQNIAIEAWSPLNRGRVFGEPVLEEIGKAHGKTTAQVVLRYHLQSGIISIPKSVKESRILENADIFDFFLTEEEVKMIESLNKNDMHGDPDNLEF